MYNGFDYHKAMEDGHAYNHYVADVLRHFGVPGVVVPESRPASASVYLASAFAGGISASRSAGCVCEPAASE